MKHLMLGILFFCLALPAFCDVTLVEKFHADSVNDQPAHDGTKTIYVKGNKARFDLSTPGNYMILDLTAKKFYVVNTQKKEVTQGSSDFIKNSGGMNQMGMKMDSKLTEGTARKVISGYNCKEYRLTSTGKMMNLDSSIWMTQDVDTKELDPYKAVMQESFKSITGADLGKLQGLTVASQSKMTMMGKTFNTSTELQSLSRKTIPDSIFAIPAEFKVTEMKMPPAQTHPQAH
jgi:Domain of unknown function (DUF4412)